MKIEVLDPILSTSQNFLRLTLEGFLDHEAFRQAIVIPRPFKFKGNPELIAQLKKAQAQKSKSNQSLEEALDEDEKKAEELFKKEKAKVESEILVNQDSKPDWYDKEWHEAREEIRKLQRAKEYGGEDLPGAHNHLVEKVEAIQEEDLNIIGLGEEETLVFTELLEAHLLRKAKEKKQKEEEEEEEGGASSDNEPGDPKQNNEEMFLESLLELLNSLKKETAKIRNKRKVLTKTQKKNLTK
jgi:hypothetical protein